jgi:hypothetical protein
MPKFEIQYARIEHQVYFLEIEADTEELAREAAREQFTGDEHYKVVHAEEFINDVKELEAKE